MDTDIYISIFYILVELIPQATQQDPIIIYPTSAIIRQQILQELRDRLDTQLIELKKEYDIEPIKGKLLIIFVHILFSY